MTPRTLTRVFNKIYGIGFLKHIILDIIITIIIPTIKTQFSLNIKTKTDPSYVNIQPVFIMKTGTNHTNIAHVADNYSMPSWTIITQRFQKNT